MFSPVHAVLSQHLLLLLLPLLQVGTDTIVGTGTKIGEKTSVKRSVVGDHCNIGKNVKISNCVIMDYVTIEDGCVNTHTPSFCHLRIEI